MAGFSRLRLRLSAATAALCLLGCSGAVHAFPPLISPVGFGPASSANWLAGAMAGYNWQRGTAVFGFEGDISGTGLRSETTGAFSVPFPTTFVYPSEDAIARIDWFGTIRGRLGWSVGSFLFYGTGGLAFGNVSLSSTYNLGSYAPFVGVSALSAQTSGVRVGWVAGVGSEYMLSKNFILSLQYLYVDLGTVSLASMSAPAPFQAITSPSVSAHAQFQAVTIGLSYKFGPSGPRAAYASMNTNHAPPPPTDPWAGLYIGGRAGGAWGNDLNVTAPPAFVILD